MNGQVEYFFESGNDAGHFSIDRVTGYVTLANPVDYENPLQRSFKILVAATDLGFPPLQNRTDIYITVLDFNDNSPIAVDAIGNIDENATNGTVAVTLTATDADSTINKDLQFL